MWGVWGAGESATRAEERETVTKAQEVIREHSFPEPNTGCWLWQGALTYNGYGKLWWEKCCRRAHRASYEAFMGPIPDGLQLDHTCRVRACVNPEHLEPVTCAENIRRSPLVGRTPRRAVVRTRKATCGRCHEFTPANTIHRSSGQRACRECTNARKRAARRRKKVM